MSFSKIAAALVLAGFVGSTQADWSLDNEHSRLNFVTIKKVNIAENNLFKTLSGSVSKDGSASVEIDLSSVESLIDIRNQRLQEILFETVKFPKAIFSTKIDMAAVEGMAVGSSMQQELVGSLDLHGMKAEIKPQVLVTRTGEKSLMVSSYAPVLVKAADFGLEGGIEKLREIAGLPNISHVVPVTFHLSLKAE